MEDHVNGWPAIEQQLARLSKKQGDIARLLNMTPAAISQVKKGSFLLNPTQMEKIANFLHYDEDMRSDFYTSLFNARMICRDPATVQAGREAVRYRVILNLRTPRIRQLREVPLADLKMLRGYECALESIAEYLLKNTPERRDDAPTGSGVCALRVCGNYPETGLNPGSIILIASEDYPEKGKLHLIATSDGKFLLRHYHPQNEIIHLKSTVHASGSDIVWNRRDKPGLVKWMHPVIEMVIRS